MEDFKILLISFKDLLDFDKEEGLVGREKGLILDAIDNIIQSLSIQDEYQGEKWIELNKILQNDAYINEHFVKIFWDEWNEQNPPVAGGRRRKSRKTRKSRKSKGKSRKSRR